MLEKSITSPKFSSAVFTCLLLLLTGCNNGEAIQSFLSADPQLSTSQDTTTNRPSSQVSESNSTISEDTNDFQKSNTNENQIETPPITELLPDFPPEIPLYPGATLEDTIFQGPESGTVTWRSQDDAESIVNYYQEQFDRNNWEILQPLSNELETQDRNIIASKDSLKVKVSLIPQERENEVHIAVAYKPFDDSLLSSSSETNGELNKKSNKIITGIPVNYFSDLNQAPEQLRQGIKEIAALDILTPYLQEGEINNFVPNKPVTRRDYARWLVAANNRYYAQSPGKKIRLATSSSELAFQDIDPGDPDFGAIQGLAEAGLIPSVLNQGSDNLLFRPDALLTREDLLLWKVPLDIRKALPQASIKDIQDSWGFQDATSINTVSIRALFADFQNGDRSNVRRIFGYTTLFQPKKPVTRGEAAVSLWYFGFQGDGITAKEVLNR